MVRSHGKPEHAIDGDLGCQLEFDLVDLVHVEVREGLVESVHLMNLRPGVRQAAEVWQGPLTLAEEDWYSRWRETVDCATPSPIEIAGLRGRAIRRGASPQSLAVRRQRRCERPKNRLAEM
jgi:hypothetical protein